MDRIFTTKIANPNHNQKKIPYTHRKKNRPTAGADLVNPVVGINPGDNALTMISFSVAAKWLLNQMLHNFDTR